MLPIENKLRRELPRLGPRLWMVPVGFGAVILLGALLLSLPFLKTGEGTVPSFSGYFVCGGVCDLCDGFIHFQYW
jgi:hypothetical protein